MRSDHLKAPGDSPEMDRILSSDAKAEALPYERFRICHSPHDEDAPNPAIPYLNHSIALNELDSIRIE
jgi:hypothetical protein